MRENPSPTSEIPAAVPAASPWLPDCGDGTYQNPVLFADYSDPDAIRVGDVYYLVASSFHAVPGLPILRSPDLVNWTLVNHVFALQPPAGHFSSVRHGEGAWAPSIRHHDGRFWVFYPDPDFGIYLSTATDPEGAWTKPVLIKPGQGLIDPCPFWDDDGSLHLIHAWARSRSGIANRLTLHALSADGRTVLDDGLLLIDGDALSDWHTLEGPKLYKRHGFYYVFAPAGGVATGYQAVFRSRQLRGPYEHRIVLDQGRTAINGPHQGAWVDTPTGEDWFLHFQDRGTYGRVVHLQPMQWNNDWPVIGFDADGNGKGEPVLRHRKPRVAAPSRPTAPQTSDEFNTATLGLQWQWNANPSSEWFSLAARPDHLRLTCVPMPAAATTGRSAGDSLYHAPNLLLQKFPAPAFTVTAALRFSPIDAYARAGLIVFGYDYAWLGLRRTDWGLRLVLAVNRQAQLGGSEECEWVCAEVGDGPVYLRVTVSEGAVCRFSHSFDHQTFQPIGAPFVASIDRWVGAKVGLFASTAVAAPAAGHADFDWFRVTAPLPPDQSHPVSP